MARSRRPKINPGLRTRLQLDPETLIRLLSKVRVDPLSGCWVWTAGRDENGYGRVKVNGRAMGAHRAFYALFKRTIPAEREIDHECENNPCCNPAHLTCRTQLVNASLGGSKRHRRLPTPPGDGIPF